tara:strand:- start:3 stop:713 length:711 start_codon:yes stop_codon:yes gene_type:complete
MIKDFVPARTSLASGIVIKQHILERNRVKNTTIGINSIIAKYGKSGSIHWNEPLTFQDITLEGTVKPQWNKFEEGTISNTSGGPGGSFSRFNSIGTTPYGPDGNGPQNIFNLTQSFNESSTYLSGSTNTIQDTQDEFYNGEFNGSQITVTQQNINPGCDPFKQIDPQAYNIRGIRMYSQSNATGVNGDSYLFSKFISNENLPTDGYISIWYQKPDSITLPGIDPNTQADPGGDYSS